MKYLLAFFHFIIGPRADGTRTFSAFVLLLLTCASAHAQGPNQQPRPPKPPVVTPPPPPPPKPPAPPPKPSVRVLTIGFDPAIKPVPGMSLARMQANIKRGIVGVERALAGTPQAFTARWQFGARTTFYVRDLRGTDYEATYGITYPPGVIIINAVPRAYARGAWHTHTWTDASMAGIAIHEYLHCLGYRDGPAMEAVVVRAYSLMPPLE